MKLKSSFCKDCNCEIKIIYNCKKGQRCDNCTIRTRNEGKKIVEIDVPRI